MDWFKLSLVVAWVIASYLISLIHYSYVKRPKNQSFELADFIVLSGCILGVLSAINLIRLVFFSDDAVFLMNKLDFSDIVTLLLGPLAVIHVSIQEIWKLFMKGKQP